MSSEFLRRFSTTEEPLTGPVSGWRARLSMLAAPQRTLKQRFADAARTIFGLTAILWTVTAINQLVFSGSLVAFGIMPRTLSGLWGIAFAPFLHGSFAHLIGNTWGLVLLGGTLILRDEDHFWIVTLLGTLFAGFGTWLIGRSNLHIGASGVIFAYFGYLLSIGWYQRKTSAILLSTAAFLIWGSLLLGMLPLVPTGVSWEGHLSGFVGGVLAAKFVGKRSSSYLA
jgi:membrane associated rhomboid family serine protease